MRAIIFGLAGMFLAGTAVAQESPPTCFGLSREQCRLAPRMPMDGLCFDANAGWIARVHFQVLHGTRLSHNKGQGWGMGAYAPSRLARRYLAGSGIPSRAHSVTKSPCST